jgi:hypothetical protein
VPDPAESPRARVTLSSAAALVVFLVGMDLWSTHHFQFGISNPAALAGVVAVLSAAVTAMQWALKQSDADRIQRSLQRAARVVFSPGVLISLYAFGVIALLMVSTVRVVADTPGAIDDVTMTPLDTARPDSGSSDEGLVRFTLFTTPFGRPIRVAAPGFLPTTFTVYPLRGLTLRLGRELPVAPSILFRPDRQALVALKADGTFRTWIVTARETTLVAETTGVASSFVLGRRPSIPAALFEDWKLELSCDSSYVRNPTLLAWKRATVLHTRGAQPGPGAVVRAEVRTPSGKRIGATEVELGSDPVIDILVPDDTARGGCL